MTKKNTQKKGAILTDVPNIRKINVRPFKSPKDMLQKAMAYFKYCNDNPVYKRELMRSGKKAGKCVLVKTARPYTFQGFCIFCGSYSQAVNHYCDLTTKQYPTEWVEAGGIIKDIIRNNQFTGALVDGFNANIVARLNGLTDNVRINTEKSSLQKQYVELDDTKLNELIGDL